MPPNKLEEEVRILREAVKRFEGMEEQDPKFEIDPGGGILIANLFWCHQRSAISAWVKEQLGEV